MWNCCIYFRLNVSHGYKLLASFQPLQNASAIIDVVLHQATFLCSWRARSDLLVCSVDADAAVACEFLYIFFFLSFISCLHFALDFVYALATLFYITSWREAKKIWCSEMLWSNWHWQRHHHQHRNQTNSWLLFIAFFNPFHFIFIWLQIDTSFPLPRLLYMYQCAQKKRREQIKEKKYRHRKSQNRQRCWLCERERAITRLQEKYYVLWNAQHSKHTNYLFSLILFKTYREKTGNEKTERPKENEK